MKNLFILLFLTQLYSCNGDERQITPSYPTSSTQTDENNVPSGRRIAYDSAHFYIMKLWYLNGMKMREVYEDKLTKLDFVREYYDNGQLKSKGTLTSSGHIYIGKWKYYSDKGKLDSVINEDLKYKISYYKALKIAEKYGCTKVNLFDVGLNADTNLHKILWSISFKIDSGLQNMKNIKIDTKTGSAKQTLVHLLR